MSAYDPCGSGHHFKLGECVRCGVTLAEHLDSTNEELRRLLGELADDRGVVAQEIQEARDRSKRADKYAAAMWALVAFLEQLGHPMSAWPDALISVFSAAIVDSGPLTPDDIARSKELAKQYGWLTEIAQ